MDKYTVDLDQVLNDFEYSELTDYHQQLTSHNVRNNKSREPPPLVTRHSINNVFHSLNEYVNTSIVVTSASAVVGTADVAAVAATTTAVKTEDDNVGDSSGGGIIVAASATEAATADYVVTAGGAANTSSYNNPVNSSVNNNNSYSTKYDDNSIVNINDGVNDDDDDDMLSDVNINCDCIEEKQDVIIKSANTNTTNSDNGATNSCTDLILINNNNNNIDKDEVSVGINHSSESTKEINQEGGNDANNTTAKPSIVVGFDNLNIDLLDDSELSNYLDLVEQELDDEQLIHNDDDDDVVINNNIADENAICINNNEEEEEEAGGFGSISDGHAESPAPIESNCDSHGTVMIDDVVVEKPKAYCDDKDDAGAVDVATATTDTKEIIIIGENHKSSDNSDNVNKANIGLSACRDNDDNNMNSNVSVVGDVEVATLAVQDDVLIKELDDQQQQQQLEEEKVEQHQQQITNNDNNNIETVTVVSLRPNNLPLSTVAGDNNELTMQQQQQQREINLIGEPGSTPYNNVYINQELPPSAAKDEINNTSSIDDIEPFSPTTSPSPTFSDTSSTATTTSSTTSSAAAPSSSDVVVAPPLDTNTDSNGKIQEHQHDDDLQDFTEKEEVTVHGVGDGGDVVTADTSKTNNGEESMAVEDGGGDSNELPVLPATPQAETSSGDNSQTNINNCSGTAEAVWLGKQAPLWIPDDVTSSCLHCDMKFSLLKRRHHCRACGLVLCAKCCGVKYYLEYLDADVRICNKCYDILNADGAEGVAATPDTSPSPPRHRNRSAASNDGTQPNPNNPLEYCSTVPPPLQQQQQQQQPPSVMVPVGVLKHRRDGDDASHLTTNRKARITKSVMFCDGIRPGSDLTNLDTDFSYQPPVEGVGGVDDIIISGGGGDDKMTTKLSSDSNGIPSKKGVLLSKKLLSSCTAAPPDGCPVLDPITKSFIPHNDNGLPPTITICKSDITYTDCVNNSSIVKRLWDETLVFALQLNLYVHLRIVNMDCCVNKIVWCFTTDGLISVGQDELIFLLELLDNDENLIPKDLFIHINNIYLDAVKGVSINELGLSLHDTSNFLNSKNHAGFIFIRATFQCVQNLIMKPNETYLFGLLIHRWETPWAKLFPLRLILRLGAEYRYYPSPIISTRYRDSVFVEIGHTIINLLADFRNFSYTIPQIRGLMIHMEDKNTTVTIPINRYDQVMKSMNNSSDHILAFAGNFSCQADSYLVCIQDTQGNENSYTTHAINIHNKPRKVTGASFIVFNGALKSTSGLTAKSSIVEDGLMIQIPSEHMIQIRDSLRNMRNHTIQCGCINAASDETVNLLWGEADVNFNTNVLSPIDDQSMMGIPSIRVHNGKDYICNRGNRLIRWTEVFIIQNCDESSSRTNHHEPVDISKVSESIAKATCNALVKYLDLLVSNNFLKIAIRTTLHIENVSYAAGSNSMKLPPIYMKSLDNELIPVLHRITSNNFSENAIILELIFRILNV